MIRTVVSKSGETTDFTQLLDCAGLAGLLIFVEDKRNSISERSTALSELAKNLNGRNHPSDFKDRLKNLLKTENDPQIKTQLEQLILKITCSSDNSSS